jgi:hypothetical protein
VATSYGKHLVALRETLLKLREVNADGFEGLVATALADLTGFTFRLAKSGSQFGRDASTPNSPFAIAMEAKRYQSKLRLEDLAGKAAVAAMALEGRMDLWILCATAEVGDDTAVKLQEILDQGGMSLLILDWSPHPDPRLGVLLAAAKTAVMDWFSNHEPSVNQAALSAQLDAIAARPNFEAVREALFADVAASWVGLDALRQSCTAWLQRRFSDAEASQLSFGQFITVSDKYAPAVARTEIDRSFAGSLAPDPARRRVIAVLGDEGMGKTWLVARWWAAQPFPPIMIVVAGRRADALDPAKPKRTLAVLLAEQDGRTDSRSLELWERRIARWKSAGATSDLRFVIVLDGLNERPDMPWADLVKALAALARDLGGLVVVTCRTAFWKRQIEPRLGRQVDGINVEVAGYSDTELDVLLARSKIKVADLPPAVREFVRNPRVCAVAIDLLDRLGVQPENLTRERLLLEYLKRRQEERGDLAVHTISEFETLLSSHAKAWLEAQTPFDRTRWAEHSGPAKMLSPERAYRDISEIEEGRFLTILSDRDNHYNFRTDSLPFALALLINAELKAALAEPSADPATELAKILDPVRGFDFVSEVIAAASGLACLDDTVPSRGRSALILYWLGLQNISEEAYQAMTAYLPDRPEAFLDIADEVEGQRSDISRVFNGLLLSKRNDPAVRNALESRINLWLGRWTREAMSFGRDDDREARMARRHDRITEAQGQLLESERRLFADLAFERPHRSAIALDGLAARLMAGRPLLPFARGWVGWAFATALAADYHTARHELEWVARLNVLDRAAFTAAVRAVVKGIGPESSELAREAKALAFRMLGDEDLAHEANTLSPPGEWVHSRRVSTFCETNPHDPAAATGANLPVARTRLDALAPDAIWLHMSSAMEDHDLGDITPALARFDPEPIVAKLRDVIATVEMRTGLSLRQLSWRLPKLSALFDARAIAAIQAACRALLADPSRLAADDVRWIHCQLVQALNPHLSATEQLDLQISLPKDQPLYYNLQNGAKPLSATEFDARLDIDDPEFRKRVLFFASASRTPLTRKSRKVILQAFMARDDAAWCAADVVFRAQDDAMDDLILAQVGEMDIPALNDDIGFAKGRAIAAAMARRNRVDLIDLAPRRFLPAIVDVLGDPAAQRLGDHIEAALNRLLRPIDVEAPTAARLILETSQDGLSMRRSITEIEDVEDPNPAARLDELADPERSARRYAERQTELINASRNFYLELSEADARDLAASPPRMGLAAFAASCPEQARRCLERLATIKDPRIARQVRNLSLAIAAAAAGLEPVLSAAAFARFRPIAPSINIVVGDERIPLYEDLLFATPSHPDLDTLKAEVFLTATYDGELEVATRAAETAGAGFWLDSFVTGQISTGDAPSIALALTISGLRDQNPVSEAVLATSYASGFLEQASMSARHDYQRSIWARHWFEAAVGANNPIGFWRFARLCARVADTRFRNWGLEDQRNTDVERFFVPFEEALQKGAEARRKKREYTLFGHKVPERTLWPLLRDPLD